MVGGSVAEIFRPPRLRVGKIGFLDSHERASYSRAIIILYSRIELGRPAVYQPDCNRVSSPAVRTDGIEFTKRRTNCFELVYIYIYIRVSLSLSRFRRKIEMNEYAEGLSSIERRRTFCRENRDLSLLFRVDNPREIGILRRRGVE